MREEISAPESTQEAKLDETGPEPGWQKLFADLCAEIAWSSDPAGETVQRLLRRCRESVEAFTGGAAGGHATGT